MNVGIKYDDDIEKTHTADGVEGIEGNCLFSVTTK